MMQATRSSGAGEPSQPSTEQGQFSHHRALDQAAELQRFMSDGKRLGLQLYAIYAGLAAYLTLYDLLTQYLYLLVDAGGREWHAPERHTQLVHMLSIRGGAVVLPLLLIMLGVRSMDPANDTWTPQRHHAVAILFASVPAAAVVALTVVTSAEAAPCSRAMAAQPEWCTTNVTTTGAAPCMLGHARGLSLGMAVCESDASAGYLTTLLLISAFMPYTYTHAMHVVMWSAVAGSAAAIVALALTRTRLLVGSEPGGFATLRAAEWATLCVWVAATHAVGLAHHLSRRKDVWEASALRLRQQRLIRSVDFDKERCEQLLANIVPAHLLKELSK